MRIFLMVLGAAFLFIAALVARFCFATAPGLDATIVDSKGNPLSGCFVVYHYELGSGFDRRPGSIIETDPKGHFRIGRKIFPVFPLWEVHPEVEVKAVYSPKTHTVTTWPCYRSLEGVVDANLPKKKMVFYDLSESPAEWFAALQNLQGALLGIYNRDVVVTNCEAEKTKLLQACTNEVALFKSRYGNDLYKKSKYLAAEDGVAEREGLTYGTLLNYFMFRRKD